MSSRLRTLAIHAGRPEPAIDGAIVAPIHRSTVWESGDEARYDDVRYPRLNNVPNQRILAARLAALEGGEAALVSASGMSAISTALLEQCSGGGRVLAIGGLYGGTHSFMVDDLPGLGMGADLVPLDDPEAWRGALTPETRAVYVETIANPLMRVPDLKAVVAFAREHGLVSLIDNTFASPVCFQPLAHGFDVVLHSATKYLNGHSDVCAGVVVGSRVRVEAIRHRINHLGGSPDPQACYLLERGLKTLPLRMAAHCSGAMRVAEFLEGHAAVERVGYPGLPSHPDHARARELLSGFGGMLCFELRGGAEAAQRFARGLKLVAFAPSLGGVESLVTIPARTSHLGMKPEERAQAGISDGLVRMSVGIEDPEDLIAELAGALGG